MRHNPPLRLPLLRPGIPRLGTLRVAILRLALFWPALLPLLWAISAHAQTGQFVGDTSDGNRSRFVHLLRLYDEFGHIVRPDDRPLMPFSPKETCRKCHDYEAISRGWHFNAADSGISPGRNGEPWILVDARAAMVVPLSYRKWEGTFRPAELGLTPFGFLSTFGHHVPGGVPAKGGQDGEDYMRWQVSGSLDINCQMCHNGDPAQDQSEYGVQVLRQNFRWAAAASSGFATVRGSAREMPDNYDLYSAVPPEAADQLPPTLTYNASRIDVLGRVMFDVPRRMPATQCEFCHSTRVIDPARPEHWESDQDVHMAAGMICVDCHRNGIDHNIIRGYEGEAVDRGTPEVATFTCRDCHMGEDNGGVPRGGAMGAPRPEHRGIPPVHFERLACTACHSGPWPAAETFRAKTSRAHALGIPKSDRSDEALPPIATPVFARLADGKFAPHDIVWPAFWAYRDSAGMRIVPPALLQPLIASIPPDTGRKSARWRVLRTTDIGTILERLRRIDSTAGDPIYVCGGMTFGLTKSGTLKREPGGEAHPYLWPIAHDVRPKEQSLGVRGCTDCHSTDAPFHFGLVDVSSPFVASPDTLRPMTEFQDVSPVSAWLFSASFLFRPGLKALVIASFLLIAAVVVLYGMRGLYQIIRSLGTENK